MAEHTPRPWRVKWTKDGRCDGISPDYHDHDGEDCYEGDHWGCPYQREIVTTDSGCYGPEPADAHLIAAAPDLLVACKAALNDRMYREWPAVADLLKAAIAKAEGVPSESPR